jgi:hypothetical protein
MAESSEIPTNELLSDYLKITRFADEKLQWGSEDTKNTNIKRPYRSAIGGFLIGPEKCEHQRKNP